MHIDCIWTNTKKDVKTKVFTSFFNNSICFANTISEVFNMDNKDIKNKLSAKINPNKESALDIYKALKDDEVADVMEKEILPENKQN